MHLQRISPSPLFPRIPHYQHWFKTRTQAAHARIHAYPLPSPRAGTKACAMSGNYHILLEGCSKSWKLASFLWCSKGWKTLRYLHDSPFPEKQILLSFASCVARRLLSVLCIYSKCPLHVPLRDLLCFLLLCVSASYWRPFTNSRVPRILPS